MYDCITIVICLGKSTKKWFSELKVKHDVSAPLAASQLQSVCLRDPTGLDILEMAQPNGVILGQKYPFVQPVF